MRLAAPSMIVDINGISELGYVRSGDDGVRVGALARHSDVELDEAAARVQPLLREALQLVAHATIRNRGTTVGSLVHADAAAEMPAVLRLLGGSLEVQGPSGRRTIAAEDLFAGPLECTLAHDEVAVSALFPALAPGAGVAFDEVARRHGDYALVGVAAHVDGDRVRAAFLSVAEVPTVVDLSGVPLADAGEAALARLEPTGDIHATAAYRAQLVRVLTVRVVRAAHEHAASRRAGRAEVEA